MRPSDLLSEIRAGSFRLRPVETRDKSLPLLRAAGEPIRTVVVRRTAAAGAIVPARQSPKSTNDYRHKLAKKQTLDPAFDREDFLKEIRVGLNLGKASKEHRSSGLDREEAPGNAVEPGKSNSSAAEICEKETTEVEEKVSKPAFSVQISAQKQRFFSTVFIDTNGEKNDAVPPPVVNVKSWPDESKTKPKRLSKELLAKFSNGPCSPPANRRSWSATVVDIFVPARNDKEEDIRDEEAIISNRSPSPPPLPESEPPPLDFEPTPNPNPADLLQIRNNFEYPLKNGQIKKNFDLEKFESAVRVNGIKKNFEKVGAEEAELRKNFNFSIDFASEVLVSMETR